VEALCSTVMASLNPWARIISTAISHNTYTHIKHREEDVSEVKLEGTFHLRSF
jgi:hypothetical protein